MTGLQESIFLSEIVLQSKIAQRASERLQNATNSFDRVEIWCSIQSILVAAGNVSKILWPTNKKYETRGDHLRKMLKIEPNNPLSDRTFRNDFEHYDERIENWFNEHSSVAYSDLAMNPNLRSNMVPNDHRGYNSFDNTLMFRGKLLNLNKIIKALEDIQNNCKPYVLA